MIQPLRTAHRRTFIVLAGVLPVILGIALTARPRVVSARIDTAPTEQAYARLNQTTAAWGKQTFSTEFYSDAKNGEVRFTLMSVHNLDEPDLLLYWSAQSGTNSPDLSGAHLLGSFRQAKSYSLPTGTQRASLILYSLAHSEIVDSARVEGLP
jgi:hypothetical protein